MTDALQAATLPGNLSADAASTLSFYTGVTSAGAYSSGNGWLTFNDQPHKWGDPVAGTTGGTVYYYFDPNSAWTAAEQGIFQAAMALWSDVANISFVQTTSAFSADYTLYRIANVGTYTEASNADAAGTLNRTASADTVFDTSPSYWSQLASFSNDGGYGVATVVHEMGHMMGLSHTGNYNSSVSPGDQRNATDSQQWSAMSYFDPAVDSNGPFGQYAGKYAVQGTKWGQVDGYGRTPKTWMPLDILAVQRLYGTPTTTALSGGQIFGFHSNVAGDSARFFDFTQDVAPVITLWDAGTGNTLDVSGFSQGGTVDLNPGTFSSVDGLVNNIGIAYGTRIDAAVAGGGATLFIGNADTLAGGGNADSVQFAGGGQAYTQSGGGASATVATSGAADTLQGIGSVVFAGGADTLNLNGSGTSVLQGIRNVVFGGAGNSSLISSGGNTIVAGSGDLVVDASGGPQSGGDLIASTVGGGLLVKAGSAVDTILGNTATVLAAGGAVSVHGVGAAAGATGVDSVQFGLGGQSFTQSGAAGAATIAAAGGAAATLRGLSTAVFGGGSDTLVLAGSGASLLQGTGNTVFGGAGNSSLISSGGNRIAAGTGQLVVDGTTRPQTAGDLISSALGGQVFVLGGSATDTILSGTVTVHGGSFVIGDPGGGVPGAPLVVTLTDSTTISFV